MAAVLGLGFSAAFVEDIYFDRLRADLDEAEELGVEFVELSLFNMDLIAGGRIIPSQVKRVHEALKARSLRYTLHGPIGVNFLQPPEIAKRHLAVAKASIEAAAEIGAERLVLHTGRFIPRGPEEIEAAYAAQRDALSAVGDFAAQHSIMVAVENIFVLIANEHTALPSRLAREIEAIGHPNVKACLDFSHAAITSAAQGANFLDEARALARVACHLHVHDSFGDPTQFWTFSRTERLAYGLGDLHLPIGWGQLPWLDMMRDFTFADGVIFNLELPRQYWFALGESVNAIREMIEVYKAR